MTHFINNDPPSHVGPDLLSAGPYRTASPPADRVVYLVTQGSYSDYKVLRAFSQRAMAEAWIGRMGEVFFIEECPLDDERDAPRPMLIGSIDLSGAVNFRMVESPQASGMCGKIRTYAGGTNGPSLQLWFVDKEAYTERATKVLAEKLTQFRVLYGDNFINAEYDRHTLACTYKWNY